LHADFDVPSSREDVDHDSPCNEQLRSLVPQAFASFYMKLITEWNTLSDPSLAAKKASIVLKYVPLEGDLFGFFKPVAKMLIEAMKNVACILTSDGTWELPSRIISYPHTNFQLRADIPADIITACLKRKTIHPDMHISNRLKKALGIQVLDASHMIELLHNVTIPRNIEVILKHLVLLLEHETPSSKESLIRQLKSMRLFKFQGTDELTALGTGNSFYIDNNDEYYASCLKYYTFLSYVLILDLSIYPIFRQDKSLVYRYS